jgi:hypothetical protein
MTSKTFSRICGVLGLLIMAIGQIVIPRNEQGYAQEPRHVALIVMFFAVFWAVFSGQMIADAMFSKTKPKSHQHPSGPSYKTKQVDGLTVRDCG